MKRWNHQSLGVVIMFLIIFLTSCNKDNSGYLLSTKASDWIDLQVGNYWIYDEITVNQFGDTSYSIASDSVYVSQDTMINGKMYYRVVGWFIPGSNSSSYLRDSAEFIVNQQGHIFFSAIPSGQSFYTYNSGLCSVDSTLTTHQYSMSLYTTEKVVGVYKPILTRHHYMDCIPFNGLTQPLTLPTKFALGVGKVEQYLVFASVFYSGGLSRLGRKLRRYHIQ